MRLPDILGSAAAEIGRHKTRSALTGFSLAVGVAAVLYTLVQVDGMRERFAKAAELAGPGRLEISRKEGHVSRGLSAGLSARDAEEIRRQWPELHMVYPLARRWGARMSYGRFREDSMVIMGTTAEWARRDWVYTLRGRFLNDHDVRTGARVCVLFEPGGWVKKPFWARWFPERPLDRLLKRKDLLGKTVRLGEHDFTVVGLLREPPRDKDPRWFRRWYGGNGTAVVPISAFLGLLRQQGGGRAQAELHEIAVDTGRAETAGLYMRRVEGLLLTRHRGERDFEIRDFRERIQGALERIRQFAAAILVIGVVAVLAGGIGIMNVTLATIFSRIREIGVRRALGATRADVIWQFVSEAMLLGLCGGVAGAGLGLLAATYMVVDGGPLREAGAGPRHVAAALLVAVGTGFLFSIYPAWQASRLDPVDALRYE